MLSFVTQALFISPLNVRIKSYNKVYDNVKELDK